MSRQTRQSLRQRIWEAPSRSLVRRFRVAASSAVRWALEGHEDFDGNLEAEEAEVFPNVGFYARPHPDHRVEAVTNLIGDEAGHPAIVATRNQDGIRLLGDLDEDETAVFNSQVHLTAKANGELHAAAIGGTPVALALKSDVDALRTAFNAHVHTGVTAGGGSSAISPTQVPAMSGTTKLKAQ